MGEWYESQKKRSNSNRKLLKERMESTNPRRELTTDKTKRLAKLEAMADKLKRGENVQSSGFVTH